MKFTDAEIEELARRIRKMKEQGTHLCCSIGFLTEKQAKILKDAGLDRINHNLNSSRAYYHNICTTHTFEQRVANIRMLQGLGFEICSGGIIGMGESKEDVVDMLLELREIQPEALPINFLLPIKGTPLGDADISGLTTEYCMKVLCLARLLVPKSDIRCAVGREVYFKGEEKKLLSVVILSLLPDILLPAVRASRIPSKRSPMPDLLMKLNLHDFSYFTSDMK